ncbi:transporter substrate-binding domain-containing protein [Clostridium chromiireducens]|uniref:ABC transporter substrate-binding protein n=1 Tax=Clostridium chromiireducens TaxID=225345 RepID=A0A1V4ITB7_9CLOT|nr:transporter substrate-binding domain-containing protein [Clostridium chromiireducens]OPJ63149.1 arginine-binding extracellular protein ArtP precursor [Clostridium chromiireducens]RII34664.1 ABC transporter substrate-binding protein [Clostridium chromiireducens]
MKRLKKIIAGVLCVATVGVLAGCGSKNASNEKVLRVGMEAAYAPFNYTQTDDANGAVKIKGSNEYANGYDVMMAKKIADKIGYTVEINKMEWDGLVPGVNSGKIDVSIAGQSITAERLQTVDFSDPYYKANIVALTKKGTAYENAKSIADLKGAICTSQLNTVWYDMLKQIPDANIQPAMDTVPSLIVALSSGKVNVVAVDKPTAMAAAYSNPDLVMLDLQGDKGFKASDEDVNMGIAIKKGNKELTDKINKALSEISEEERNKMMEEAIKVQPLSK